MLFSELHHARGNPFVDSLLHFLAQAAADPRLPVPERRVGFLKRARLVFRARGVHEDLVFAHNTRKLTPQGDQVCLIVAVALRPARRQVDHVLLVVRLDRPGSVLLVDFRALRLPPDLGDFVAQSPQLRTPQAGDLFGLLAPAPGLSAHALVEVRLPQELAVPVAALHVAAVVHVAREVRPALLAALRDEPKQEVVLCGGPALLRDMRVETAEPALAALRPRPPIADEDRDLRPVVEPEPVDSRQEPVVFVWGPRVRLPADPVARTERPGAVRNRLVAHREDGLKPLNGVRRVAVLRQRVGRIAAWHCIRKDVSDDRPHNYLPVRPEIPIPLD